jgi:hypothetical protein
MAVSSIKKSVGGILSDLLARRCRFPIFLQISFEFQAVSELSPITQILIPAPLKATEWL